MRGERTSGTIPVWPAFVGAPVLDAIRIGAPVGAIVRTDMDAGPAKQRRRFTAAPRPVALAFEPLGARDLARFEAFVERDLAGGALAFEMVHPLTDLPGRFRLVAGDGAWSMAPIGRDAWRLDVEMELLP